MTPLAGDTRRTVRWPEWRRKQTLVLFHRHADGGHRCAVDLSDQPGREVVDPDPGLALFPVERGDPQVLGMVVVIRLEVKSADILHPLDGAADLAVQGAFLEVAGVAETFRGGHPVHRDHLRRECLAERHGFRFQKRAPRLFHLCTPSPLVVRFIHVDSPGTFTRALPSVSPRRPPPERCTRFRSPGTPSFPPPSAGSLPAPLTTAMVVPDRFPDRKLRITTC